MRGKGIPYSTAQKWSRITPAYAGKSRSQHLPPSLSWDHPRLCGEKKVEAALDAGFSGSPPPMRGKAFLTTCRSLSNRITPAYAGKSPHLFAAHFCGRDHPRLCGEKWWKCDVTNGIHGSPPPMRGKGVALPRSVSGSGITPAYAGKRSILYDAIDTMRDHPRLCGEKEFTNGGRAKSVGITPAYAGKSHSVPAFSKVLRDHPRLCGEKRYSSMILLVQSGSPPPMRGKVVDYV